MTSRYETLNSTPLIIGNQKKSHQIFQKKKNQTKQRPISKTQTKPNTTEYINIYTKPSLIKFAHYFETLTEFQNTKPFHRLVSWLVSNNAQCLDTVVIQTIITRERLRDTVRFIFRAEKCIFAMAINLMGYRAGRQTSCVSSEIKALIGWMANIRIVFLF